MKEIKFRVWDKEEKQIKNVDSIHFPLGKSSGKDISIYNEKEDCYEWVYDYKIMRYTGIEDKNKKEIYEGDILAIDDFSFENFSEFKNYGEIKYNNCRFYIKMKDGYHDELINVPDIYEVVGNIYENSELLD